MISKTQDIENDVEPSYPRPVTGPFHVEAHPGGSTSSNIAVDQSSNVNKPMPWIVLIGVIAGISLGLGIGSMFESNRAERESRMLQYYLLELDAKVIKAGIKQPDEAISKRLEESKK